MISIRCKHGMEKSGCSICSGFIQHKKEVNYRYGRIKNWRIKKEKEYQHISMENASRFKAPILDWELDSFIKETDEVQDISRLYTLAISFNRSYNAMKWWWKLTYMAHKFNPDNHHAKDIIERIKKHKTLVEVLTT